MNMVPAYLGGTAALATEATVGEAPVERDPILIPGDETLAEGEIRVSILGSGLPWVTKSQAAGSVLVEVGNPERDVFVFDLGAGSLANFSGLKVPVTSLTKVFFSHLHADHIADYLTLMGSYVKSGRLDPVEVWGGSSDDPARGLTAFVEAIDRAMAWDFGTLLGYTPTSGAKAIPTEVPYDRAEVVYERNGVTITSFPVIHVLSGAVGYRIDYAGQSVVFSGDTMPAKTLIEAAQGCDLLIHETFLPAETFAELMTFPIEKARMVVNDAHTPPDAAGIVFSHVKPKMAAMWHTHVIDGYIEPVFDTLRTTYSGPATLCQDLTVFNVTPQAVEARQATVSPVQQAVVGESKNEFILDDPLPPPAWWKEAQLDWQAELPG
ncbi:MAG: guanitoxin biosynthesis MBL fold metallo-hydrolase GntH [Acidimicrobiia bacterium]|nr:guanitoxin biosynthesis MBL fold metallo-hydrolase GntH [Acidimicrobiia bacterium]